MNNLWVFLVLTYVRLNLFNHVLALFRAKFSCNLIIRYPVFRWELCKGTVWKNVKNTQMCALKKSLTTGSRDWRVTKGGTHVKHVGELKGHANYSTTRQNFQSGQVVSSRLVPVARLSSQNALFNWNLTFRISHIPYYKYPYTHEM